MSNFTKSFIGILLSICLLGPFCVLNGDMTISTYLILVFLTILLCGTSIFSYGLDNHE
ncbi:hypothetical protein PMW03_01345 [Clostridium paraputrificum]|uniref:hypothetical protein n=1 Tax=Clostridium paraputrificum TaxID=29363 RepID=UPI00189A3162|nr:hypothetical protein [Clostridium paraputrificum]MDB2108783.1 hypothetical protein [Clostridium paraputrificum]